jgi:asparaginyl-tRNA synthetase
MAQQNIKDLANVEGQEVTMKGWVANRRESKGLAFIIMRDGTGFCQCVVNENAVTAEVFDQATHLNLEDVVSMTGEVVKDEKQIGGYELQVSSLRVIEKSEDYPIAKKEHGVGFLMDHRHLWLRSMRQWAIMRIRNRIIMAIHQFFQERDFIQMDAPMFTGNAVEGTTDLFETDFFGQPAYLSQSGQLYGEAMAMAQSKIYTFGPTFRAEKSKTRRHLSEFWMIEPEMAFYDLEATMDLIEDFIRSVVKEVLTKSEQELGIINRDTTSLQNVDQHFPRLTYHEAVQILKGEKEVNGRNSLDTLENDIKELEQQIADMNKEIEEKEAAIEKDGLKKGKLNHYKARLGQLKADVRELEERKQNIPEWLESARNFQEGDDFGGSDETVITRLFDSPIMIYNWPKDIKAFYMKRVEDDENYVKGVDVLAPEGFGEIVGGAERETNKEFLIQQIHDHNLPKEAFEWYLDLRRYGSVTHSGFGLGLERFVAWICNLHHVRETIPFPRMYGRLFP